MTTDDRQAEANITEALTRIQGEADAAATSRRDADAALSRCAGVIAELDLRRRGLVEQMARQVLAGGTMPDASELVALAHQREAWNQLVPVVQRAVEIATASERAVQERLREAHATVLRYRRSKAPRAIIP